MSEISVHPKINVHPAVFGGFPSSAHPFYSIAIYSKINVHPGKIWGFSSSVHCMFILDTIVEVHNPIAKGPVSDAFL